MTDAGGAAHAYIKAAVHLNQHPPGAGIGNRNCFSRVQGVQPVPGLAGCQTLGLEVVKNMQ